MFRPPLLPAAWLLAAAWLGPFFPALAQEKPPLWLSFTGDLMAHSINYRMEDYSRIYAPLGRLFWEDDLTFTNVEFPMDPSRGMSTFPVFNIHPSYLGAFIDAGADVLSLANNHTGDAGPSSLRATAASVRALAEEAGRPLYFSGIESPGLGTDRLGGYPVTAFTYRGWRIGFIALSQYSNAPVESGSLFLLNYDNAAACRRFLEELKAIRPGYDLFIVSYHGGVEYATRPQQAQVDFYRSLAAAGADIVWGQHSHVLQPVEILETSPGPSYGIIFYSLGNFLSGQGRIIDETLPEEDWSYTGDSAVFQIRVVPAGAPGAAGEVLRPSVSEVKPIAIANYMNPNREILLYLLEDLADLPLPPPWDEFYRERRRIMRDFFARNIRKVE
ncbi:MAG: CapA family protein [Spirochaetales bacterium]|jgi:poly-gamma-glutamate synthesis protein (capsule biosynthesis protein)|nr:CapA family protein [Spirochaetales bacterium]